MAVRAGNPTNKGRFGPGNKGGGRRKIPPDVKEAFKAACQESVDILLDLMRNSDDDNVRLKAAIAVQDRALGKCVQPVSNPDGSGLYDKLLEAIKRADG